MRFPIVLGLPSLLICLYSFFFALAVVRMNFSPFPGHADGCWYDAVARNVAQGRGLVEDTITHFAIPYRSVTHPVGNYWNPLVPLALGYTYRLFGVSPLAGRMPALLMDALIVLALFEFARRRLRSTALAAAAFLIYTVHPANLDFRTTGGFGEQFLLFFNTLFLISLTAAVDGRRWCYGLAALFGGLSYLSRNEGGLSLLILGGAFYLSEIRTRRWAGYARPFHALLLLAGAGLIFVLTVAPWEIRNRMVYGALANEAKYRFFFVKGYFDIWSASQASTMAEYFGMGLGKVAVLKLVSYYYKADLFTQIIGWPLLIFIVPGLFALRRERWVQIVGGGFITTYIVMGFLNSVSQQAGWHGVYTYNAFWIPIALAGMSWAAGEFAGPSTRTRSIILTALCLGTFLYFLGNNAKLYRHRDRPPLEDLEQTMHIAAAALRELSPNRPPIVMSHFDFHLNYYAGIRGVKIPTNDPPEVIHEMARRYGCTHIVLFGDTAPSLKPLYDGRITLPWLRRVRVISYPVKIEGGGDRIEIYEIIRDKGLR